MKNIILHTYKLPVDKRILSVIFLLLAGLACRSTAGLNTENEEARTTTSQASTLASPTKDAEPTATSTPAHTPTPLPTTIPTTVQPKILFSEGFEDKNTCFKTKSLDPDIELSIKNQAYHIRINGDDGFQSMCYGGYDDFVLEFDLQMNSGSAHSLVGLIFRLHLGTSYNIYLTGENNFCWDYYDDADDIFRPLVGCWRRLPDKFDIADSLHIRIIAVKERMALVIDDELLAITEDPSNEYGTFGFFVGNHGPGATEVIIDNILIREVQFEDLDVFRRNETG